MTTFEGRQTKDDDIPTVQAFEGIGELTVGGTVAGGDINRVHFTCLALLNNPTVNSYLLANKVKLQDRITKTKIFPRDGMPLQGDDTFVAPPEEVVEPSTNQENV